jgi:hypothetical protein
VWLASTGRLPIGAAASLAEIQLDPDSHAVAVAETAARR